MKKLYISTLALAASSMLSAQFLNTDLPLQMNSISNPLVTAINPTMKSGIGGSNSVMASTFSKYLDRATAFNMVSITVNNQPIPTTATIGLQGQLGNNFDNSASVSIDRVAVMFSGKRSGAVSQNFDVSIYNRNAADSLPTGSALATVPFTVAQVNAPDLDVTPTFDFTQFTIFTLSSPLAVTGPFCVSINMDDTTGVNSKDRLYLPTNSVNNGDGNNEKRIFTRPTPGLVAGNANFQMQWYKQENFWQIYLGASGPVTHNVDLIIVPLVVGESSVVSSDEIFGVVNGLTYNGHYPNPAVNNVTISYTLANLNKEVAVKVYDMSGRVVKEIKENNVAAGKHNLEIDVTNFAAGEYIYTLLSDDGKISSSIIVSK